MEKISVRPRRRAGTFALVALAVVALAASVLAGPAPAVAAGGPNTVAVWNKIAEDTVVGSGAFQIEGFVYMAYESSAVYDAVVAIRGRYRPLGHEIEAPRWASMDAAVVEAAYETLVAYFPASAGPLGTARDASLAALADGRAKTAGIAVGHRAAQDLITMRTGDGRQTPIGTTSSFPTMAPGPGVWRLTPPAYLAPQTPWAATMKPFVLPRADRFLPPPPPALSSAQWVADFNEIKAIGQDTSTLRTPAQTATAKFWTANVIRQDNRLVRDIADARSLGPLQTARLAAMVNVVDADAGISVLNAKYHYLFWRPVTAIDPTSVKATGDGFGPVPGFDDGNPLTVEQPGWRPLIATPNHPEYPAAHGTVTSALAQVLTAFLGTTRINVDIHGFDAAGAGRQPRRCPPLRVRQRPAHRDHRCAVVGRAPLPHLQQRRRRPRPERGPVRPPARVRTGRLSGVARPPFRRRPERGPANAQAGVSLPAQVTPARRSARHLSRRA